ncbi:adenine nucleotide alpha hydrolase family protein [Ekhidna lutea]|nr:ATP-binding protein [Ekhidna lutea]
MEEKKPTILCMFSGGIDSTGVLHQLITDEKYKDHPLIVHHIHIFNRENRARAEAMAVKTILSYYKENTERPFLVTESTFNTTGFAPLKANRFPFDMDVCAFMAGNICTARKDVKSVAMGRTKTDVESGGENFMARMKRAQAIFKSVLALEKSEAPTYIFPVVEFTKQEVWEMLPADVRKNTWWCRTPIYIGDKAQSCGKCHTCNDVKKFSSAEL